MPKELPFYFVLLLLLVQISCSAAGNTIVASGMRRKPVVKIRVIFGTATLALGFGIFTLLMRYVDLSILAPAGAGSYLIITLLSRFVLKESVPPLRWAGTSLVAAGITLVMLTNQP